MFDGVIPERVRCLIHEKGVEGGSGDEREGSAFHTFLMDKTPDALWDHAVKQFLEKHQLDYEEL